MDLLINIFCILVFIWICIDNLNMFNIHGKVITKLNTEPSKSHFIIFCLILMIGILIYTCLNKQAQKSIIIQLIFFIIATFLLLNSADNYSKATEKGIYTELGFYNWKQFKNYEWISNDTIQLKGKRLKLISFKTEITVDLDKKLEADLLFKENVKI